jgi:hypothetical protein
MAGRKDLIYSNYGLGDPSRQSMLTQVDFLISAP